MWEQLGSKDCLSRTTPPINTKKKYVLKSYYTCDIAKVYIDTMAVFKTQLPKFQKFKRESDNEIFMALV